MVSHYVIPCYTYHLRARTAPPGGSVNSRFDSPELQIKRADTRRQRRRADGATLEKARALHVVQGSPLFVAISFMKMWTKKKNFAVALLAPRLWQYVSILLICKSCELKNLTLFYIWYEFGTAWNFENILLQFGNRFD